MTPTLEKEIIKLPSDQDASGRTFGAEEIAAVTEVLTSGVLITTKGKYGKLLEKEFAEKLGVKYAYLCNSGSAAVHVAVAAINPNPGDEIITTSVTDMGALTPIIFQGAIPVFADVDPKTLNVTAETIEKVLSERTKAIIVTHLFGNPCEMQAIMELADSKKHSRDRRHGAMFSGNVRRKICWHNRQDRRIFISARQTDDNGRRRNRRYKR